MRIIVKQPKENSVNLMRRLGYGFQKQISNSEIAFIRPLGSSGFPRFHIYMKKSGNDFLIDIHLDQHKETYGEAPMHHGEYENDGALAKEVKRIKELL
jgi:hypothetical protein